MLRPNIPIGKPKAKHDILTHMAWLQSCIDEAEKLTVWETDFIDSITTQLQARRELSFGQEATLERIYAERTS